MKLQPIGTNFKSTRSHVVNSVGKTVNCHYTNFARKDIDWKKFVQVLAKRFELENEILVNIFGCSDASEVYTLKLAILTLPEKIANKFRIIASDISEKIIDEVNQKRILLHDKDIEFLKENDGLKYFTPDSTRQVEIMRGMKFYPHFVNDLLIGNTKFLVKDIRKESKDQDFSNQSVLFRNGWTYNTLDEQEQLAKNLYKNSNEKTLVVIGQSDLFKSDANRVLQDSGFKGIESEIFTANETDYPSETIGKPKEDCNYKKFILFEKKQPSFKGYRQYFTDKEFEARLQESVDWAKQNVDSSKYFKTKKRMGKKLEKNAKGGIKLLESYRYNFKKSNFEPFVELAISGNDLVGKVRYLSTTPVEIRTQMPCDFKGFFEKISQAAKNQVREDKLRIKLWNVIEEEKYLQQKANKRFKELCSANDKQPNPLVLAFDSVYPSLLEKLVQIEKQKNGLLSELEMVKSKLKNHQFKLKLKA